MAYTIEYFREGLRLGATSWSAAIADTVKMAKHGLITHDADFARILDEGGAEVDSVKPDRS